MFIILLQASIFAVVGIAWYLNVETPGYNPKIPEIPSKYWLISLKNLKYLKKYIIIQSKTTLF